MFFYKKILLAIFLCFSFHIYAMDYPQQTENPEILPLSDVKIGMPITAYTVFKGYNIEPFTGRVEGIVKNYMGPLRDIILVRFDQDRLKHYSIVHGMSGSPVYYNNKLIGALSLALGPFPKDPIAGVTPIEHMIEDSKLSNDTRSSILSIPNKVQVSLDTDRMPSLFNMVADSPISSALAKISNKVRYLWSPIISGLDSEVFEKYAGSLSRLNFNLSDNHSGTFASHNRSEPSDEKMIKAGGAVSVVLVDGDVGISGTGTVTYRKNDEVYAFGHTFLQQGIIDLPMSTAEIVETIADQTYPYKIANLGSNVGRFKKDRLSAIVGNIGSVPEMIPIGINIFQNNRLISSFSYRIINQVDFTSDLLQMVIANSIRKQWRFVDDGSYKIKSKLLLANGTAISFENYFSVSPSSYQGDSYYDVVRYLTEPFSVLYQNKFKPEFVKKMDVTIEYNKDFSVYSLQHLFLEDRHVVAGNDLSISMNIQEMRGRNQVKNFKVQVPLYSVGKELMLVVADAKNIEKTGAISGRFSYDSAKNVDSLLSMLNKTRKNNICYVQLRQKISGISVQNQYLPMLPKSFQQIMLKNSFSDETLKQVDSTVLWEGEIPFDGKIIGEKSITFSVVAKNN